MFSGIYLIFSFVVTITLFVGYSIHKHQGQKRPLTKIDAVKIYMIGSNIAVGLFLGVNYLKSFSWVQDLGAFIQLHILWHLALPMLVWKLIKSQEDGKKKG